MCLERVCVSGGCVCVSEEGELYYAVCMLGAFLIRNNVLLSEVTYNFIVQIFIFLTEYNRIHCKPLTTIIGLCNQSLTKTKSD